MNKLLFFYLIAISIAFMYGCAPAIPISPTQTLMHTPMPTNTIAPTPTPIGSKSGKIYFSKANVSLGKNEYGELPYDIFSINVDGSEIINISNNHDTDISYIEVASSPDGNKIAFVKQQYVIDKQYGNRFTHEIYVMNPDGTNIQKISSYPQFFKDVEVSRFISEVSPAWSPDGNLLSFQSNRNFFSIGNRLSDFYQIYTINLITNEIKRLTNVSADNYHPTWSPDGSKISFMSNRDGNWDIYVMNSDGSGKDINITNNKFSNRFPDWSPDGNWIVFHSDRDGNIELYKMKPDGSSIIRLTYNPAIDGSASWSPDGNWIAFSSDRTGNEEIYLLYLMTNETIQLTRTKSTIAWINWKK